MAETNWQKEIKGLRFSPRASLSAPWRVPTVDNPQAGSIFANQRALPPSPVKPAPIMANVPSPMAARPTAGGTTYYSHGPQFPDARSPEKLDVHHQYHVGGSMGEAAA